MTDFAKNSIKFDAIAASKVELPSNSKILKLFLDIDGVLKTVNFAGDIVPLNETKDLQEKQVEVVYKEFGGEADQRVQLTLEYDEPNYDIQVIEGDSNKIEKVVEGQNTTFVITVLKPVDLSILKEYVRIEDINLLKPKDGRDGRDGERGEDGVSIKGDKGDKGEDGVSIKGDKGDKGDKGEDGVSIKGDKGDRGDRGEQGEQGPAGKVVYTGGGGSRFKLNGLTTEATLIPGNNVTLDIDQNLKTITINANVSGGSGPVGDYVSKQGDIVYGPLLEADGDATNPSYSFESDPNTGISHSPVDGLQISTDGIKRINIYNDGGMQIGGIYGISPGNQSLQLGGVGYVLPTLPNARLKIVDDVNSYAQTNIQNVSPGDYASSDYVATNDIGTDEGYYLDLGINGSGFVNEDWTINGANDVYLYAGPGSNLAIGTGEVTGHLSFFSGGTLAENEHLRIMPDGGLQVGGPFDDSNSPGYGNIRLTNLSGNDGSLIIHDMFGTLTDSEVTIEQILSTIISTSASNRDVMALSGANISQSYQIAELSGNSISQSSQIAALSGRPLADIFRTEVIAISAGLNSRINSITGESTIILNGPGITSSRNGAVWTIGVTGGSSYSGPVPDIFRVEVAAISSNLQAQILAITGGGSGVIVNSAIIELNGVTITDRKDSKTLQYNLESKLIGLTGTVGSKQFNYNSMGQLTSISGTGKYMTKAFEYQDGKLIAVGVI